MRKVSPQYAALALLLTWAFIAEITFSSNMIFRMAKSPAPAGLPFVLSEYSNRISFVPPEYKKGQLRTGDEVLAINGVSLLGKEQIGRLAESLKLGETLHITYRQRSVTGVAQTSTTDVRLFKTASTALGWVALLALIVLPISCLIVGFMIALVRPRDPLAWITLAMLASFGQIATLADVWTIHSPWREIFLVYHSLLSELWPLWVVLFGMYFPVPFRFIEKRRWLNWLLAIPFSALAAIEVFGSLREGKHLETLTGLGAFEESISTAEVVLFAFCVAAFLGMLIAKQRGTDNRDARRRLTLLIAGCTLAIVPIAIYVLTDLNVIQPVPPWTAVGLIILLLFFPATMAYVIIVQRAMDIRMVVRTGVRYALASTGLRILQFLLFALVTLFTVRFALDAQHHWQTLVVGLIGALVLLLLRTIGNKAGMLTDRRFFREAYNAEIILTELASSVAGFRDTKALMDTVSHRIADSLHCEPIAILMEKADYYEPACLLGFKDEPLRTEFGKQSATSRFLLRQNAPAKVFFEDAQSWVHGVSEQEQEALRQLRTQVLVPVTQKHRMLGFLSLGPKKSEAPYSREDLQLLSAVASQAGLAFENARLTEDIRQEVAQRERANRELEIAREVQQRLFPQKLPVVKGLDFAGYCRPALGVGGDYYDFIQLDDGCLGIAVGDVSGKGIAAALMMASLQASLRGQTIKPCSTLGEMIQHVNRLVFEASSENRYATFFYAQYDPATRMMRYCNAGHNPPLLYREANGRKTIRRLDQGGTVIGLFPEVPFLEAAIQVEPGDILVGYTDGISEAMNEQEEEFGEERLSECASGCETRCAADMITCMLRHVDAFTGEAPQHDDMTLVVVRVQ